MTKHSLIKTALVLFAALFLSVQGLAQAHAVANGSIDHTHDGIACDVTLVAAEQTVLMPPTPNVEPVEQADALLWHVRANSNLPRNFDGRAPPPRGPPTL